MNKLSDWILETLGISKYIQENVAISLIIILILWIIYFISMRIVYKKIQSVKERYLWRNAINYILFFIGFVVLLVVWVEAYSSLGTFFGLLSAGLAVALKDPITNFFAWIFIITRRPFQVGDRVEIEGLAGDIIDIRIFQFTVNEIGNWVDADQSTGRIIHVPNGFVFTKPQANFTRGFSHIWNEIPILITFESDWKLGKKLLLEVAEKHAAHLSKGAQKKLLEASRKYMIFYRKLTPIVYTSVKDSGIMLTIRYLCLPQRRRSSEQAIWEDILNIIEKHDNINLAYPTQRIHFDPADIEIINEIRNKRKE